MATRMNPVKSYFACINYIRCSKTDREFEDFYNVMRSEIESLKFEDTYSGYEWINVAWKHYRRINLE